MKGIKFANVVAVWKWSCKPIYMLVFPQYFALNVHHINNSIYIWNCCNQAKSLDKKWSWNVLWLKFKKYSCNSTHSYNRRITSWYSFLHYISMLWVSNSKRNFLFFDFELVTRFWNKNSLTSESLTFYFPTSS